jgi:hypothetical protein
MADKLDDKWITPQALATEKEIPLSTISTWIKLKQIPVFELPGNPKRRRYLVDKTAVPVRRGPGRPWN